MGQARRRVANCFMFRADTKVSTAQEEKVRNKGQDGKAKLKCLHVLKLFPRQTREKVPDGEMKATQTNV